jgi:hypothetical protein
MKTRNNKLLLKYLDSTLEDSKFNLDQLLDEHFFNFQFDDNYGFYDYPNKGLIRKRIVKLLFEIHDNWKIELEKLNKPYYLAIWLCEPQIIRSDVVCAIGERIEMYSENWFDKSEKDNSIIKEAYGKSQFQFNRFTWERKNLYDTHESWEFDMPKGKYQTQKEYNYNRRYYSRIKKKCTKIVDEKNYKTYYEKIGDVWVGQEKKDIC